MRPSSWVRADLKPVGTVTLPTNSQSFFFDQPGRFRGQRLD